MDDGSNLYCGPREASIYKRPNAKAFIANICSVMVDATLPPSTLSAPWLRGDTHAPQLTRIVISGRNVYRSGD